MGEISEDVMIAEVERRLISSFPQVPDAEVSSTIAIARTKFGQSPIRDFVPLFVERNAAAQLNKLESI